MAKAEIAFEGGAGGWSLVGRARLAGLRRHGLAPVLRWVQVKFGRIKSKKRSARSPRGLATSLESNMPVNMALVSLMMGSGL